MNLWSGHKFDIDGPSTKVVPVPVPVPVLVLVLVPASALCSVLYLESKVDSMVLCLYSCELHLASCILRVVARIRNQG